MCERVEKSFLMLLVFFLFVIALKIVLLHTFVCAAHSLTYIFIFPSTETKGKIHTLLSIFQIHIKLTCVLLSTGLRILFAGVWAAAKTKCDLCLNGSLSRFLSFCCYSISKNYWMGLRFRCTYTQTHINVLFGCNVGFLTNRLCQHTHPNNIKIHQQTPQHQYKICSSICSMFSMYSSI